MPKDTASLLAGRNQGALSESEVRRAVNTFIGFDDRVSARYEPGSATRFRVFTGEEGIDEGEIVFGEDFYPGPSIIDPNSAMSISAAACHELTHYYRWRDKVELPLGKLEHIDEALTSLQAILRYGDNRMLSPTDIKQLVGDAMQRLRMYVAELDEAGGQEEMP